MVVADHRAYVEYLHLRDVVVRDLDAYQDLRSTTGTLRAWVDRDWRAIHRLVAAEIAVRLSRKRHKRVKSISPAFHSDVGRVVVELRLSLAGARDTAVLLEWQVGKGLTVPLRSSLSSLEALERVRAQLLSALPETVRALPNQPMTDKWSVEVGVAACLEGLGAIEPVLLALQAREGDRG